MPLAGLTPWREVVTPHPDVASGKFSGVVCHFHITKEKIDCAGLDVEKIIK
jgi:hypothetical protein